MYVFHSRMLVYFFLQFCAYPNGAQDLMFPRKRGLINHSPKLQIISSEEKRRKKNQFIFTYFFYDIVTACNFSSDGYVYSHWECAEVSAVY